MRTFNFQMALLALTLGAGPAVAAEPAPSETAANKQERLDRYGDPLPPGALFRLGTVRLRASGWIYSVAVAPDGKTLAYGGYDKHGGDLTIRLCEVATGRQIRALAGHQLAILSVCFAPDGKTLASGGRDRTIRLWDVATGKETPNLGRGSRRPARGVCARRPDLGRRWVMTIRSGSGT